MKKNIFESANKTISASYKKWLEDVKTAEGQLKGAKERCKASYDAMQEALTNEDSTLYVKASGENEEALRQVDFYTKLLDRKKSAVPFNRAEMERLLNAALWEEKEKKTAALIEHLDAIYDIISELSEQINAEKAYIRTDLNPAYISLKTDMLNDNIKGVERMCLSHLGAFKGTYAPLQTKWHNSKVLMLPATD